MFSYFSTYTEDDSLLLKTEVSVKVLHRMREETLGHGCVYSANFCAKNPPKADPKR